MNSICYGCSKILARVLSATTTTTTTRSLRIQKPSFLFTISTTSYLSENKKKSRFSLATYRNNNHINRFRAIRRHKKSLIPRNKLTNVQLLSTTSSNHSSGKFTH